MTAMKKVWLMLSAWLCASLLAAQDMKSLFVSMPDSVIPLLTKVNREDCVDFLDSKMKAEVKNRFGQPSELKVLTADYFLLQTTGRSTMEMKLLPLNDSVKVICAVHTVGGPAYDSHLSFYDLQWNSLPQVDFIQLPSRDAFFLSADSLNTDTLDALRRKADMELVKASLSADKSELSFVYTTPQYMSKEDQEKIQAYIKKEPVIYEWKEGRFELLRRE